MKCFKFLSLFILLISQVYAKDYVAPLEVTTINNGEIYEVLVVSDKTDEELAGFVNTKINDVMFVLDFKRENENRIFEVFVTDPPQPQKNQEPTEPPFAVSGLKYEYIKKNTQGKIEYISIDYEEALKNNWVKILISIIFILLVVAVFYFFIRIRKSDKYILKKLKKQKAKELKKQFENAKSREDFENLYNDKKYYLDLFTNHEELDEFFKRLNKVQYKKDWKEEDIKYIRDAQVDVDILRSKNGV